MASVALFGPADPGSNPGWFAVLNSNKKLSVTNITSMQYSRKYHNSAMAP